MSSRPSRGAARLAAILDALPDGLVLVNCNGTVVNANTIALELFETPGTALVGRGLLDLLPTFDSRLIPGSMRSPEAADERGRTKPTRMVARRTDGGEFPVEVTSASLEDGREAYDSYNAFTGDELLMLVVRDLSGTMDTEAELARSQRQTEMILRAAAEGVVGTDTEGRVVLVNPAAAQILGFRASDLGGRELHPLILHSRENGEPFPYPESPLADTLRSGRKHRVRGQVLWAKNGSRVPVDLTTAPVRDGDQLVGAVMTFTDRRPYESLTEQHESELAETTERLNEKLTETSERLSQELADTTERLNRELAETTERFTAELADRADRYTAEIEGRDERYLELAARHDQLTAVLGASLRGPLEELRAELGTLAADPAGQLWPEANQVLHHLVAGYARMTTLIDNVLGFQRLDGGGERLYKSKVLLDAVVAAGIEGAIELIGPGRVQFAVHAPPIEAEVDAVRLATALAHLAADVAGVDSTGRTRLLPEGGYGDSTVVVAAAQRGEVVRIEVRGAFTGGDPVHEPIVRGIVQAHGGVLQTHDVPGMSGSAYVLEVPLGDGAGMIAPPADPMEVAGGVEGVQDDLASRDALDAPDVQGPDGGTGAGSGTGTGSGTGAGGALALPEQQQYTPSPETLAGGGRRRARRGSTDAFLESAVAPEEAADESDSPGVPPTGRRRAVQPQQELTLAPDPDSTNGGGTGRRRGRPSPAEEAAAVATRPSEGSVVTAAEGAAGRPALGQAVPPQGVPLDAAGQRARHSGVPELAAAPAVPTPPGPPYASPVPAQAAVPAQSAGGGSAQAGGRRARRALAPAPAEGQEPGTGAEGQEGSETSPAETGRSAFALPPAAADRLPPTAGAADASQPGRHDLVRTEPGTEHHTPPHEHPAPTGRRRAHGTVDETDAAGAEVSAGVGIGEDDGADAVRGREAVSGLGNATAQGTGSVSLPLPPLEEPANQGEQRLVGAPGDAGPDAAQARAEHGGQALPAETPLPGDASQGRAFSVRTLGQGVPFSQQTNEKQNQSLGSGRRRKLSTPPDGEREGHDAVAKPHPQAGAPGSPASPSTPPPSAQSAPRRPGERAEGRAYAIGAPDEGAEGPEPLDGPGGAVEVANRPQPHPVDDELPPEPLDNPRRLLVWPAPDVSTQQALSDRGYRPVVVHSREEVDAQIAAFPAALFVDPLTGPITRTALQSLRQAAVAAEVPVLVTAGLGQATREAAYGADPAILLKALAPRDSEQHPSRVLLIEEHEEIALALTATLERRGMQVARAGTDADAVTLAAQMRPNLVVMDLMQVRRRRAGIIDWLRANGQLNRTPLVVYTSAGLNRAELPRLSSGETVLFLAERSTSGEVQARIVDLLAKIGTN
ncbi:PAS domain-containing protein [Streptomyces sp. NPDC020965]|uniref:PAS domain-containing protein n=1 Tax=Streptomyces sp. NPDC020965 TaxID=3365105 RepID=UPI0037A2D752